MVKIAVHYLIGIAFFLFVWVRRRQQLSWTTLLPVPLAILLFSYNLYSNQLYPMNAGTSRTFDGLLYFIDGGFGRQPSVVMAQLGRQLPWLRELSGWVYEALRTALLITGALHLGRRKYWQVVATMTLIGTLGVLAYRLLPACGPAYLLGDDCFYGTGTQCDYAGSGTVDMELRFARNAFPSLHVAWVLIIWWSFLGRRRVLVWSAFLFAVFTIAATLIYGEHYLVDVAAAFPFALAFWELSFGRVAYGVAGAMGYFAWLISLRFFPALFTFSPVIPWSATLLSVVIPVWIVMAKSRQDLPDAPNTTEGQVTGALGGKSF